MPFFPPTIKVGADGEDKEVPPIVHWVVDLPDEINVLQACDSGLRRLLALLEEWKELSKGESSE
jgi:hypothetical protein